MTIKINYREPVPVKRIVDTITLDRERIKGEPLTIYNDSRGVSIRKSSATYATDLSKTDALELAEALTLMAGEL